MLARLGQRTIDRGCLCLSFVCYPLALIVGLHVAVCDQEALPVLSCMAGRKEEGEVAFFLFE